MTTVLGINYSNDAAAALVRDGHVLGACQEERFRRTKHYAGFPERAIDWCLADAGLRFDDVDEVAFFWNPGIHAETLHRSSTSRRHHLEFLYNVPNMLCSRWLGGQPVTGLSQELRFEGRKPLRIEYVTHHLAHAASAFYRSNFEESAVLIVDGYGERASATILHAQGTSFRTLLTVDFPHSIGAYYAAFTDYLGFKANSGEGKVMGLASYGRETPLVDEARSLWRLTDTGFELDLSYFSYFLERRERYSPKLVARFGPARRADEPLTERHEDIAYAMQVACEDALVHLGKLAKQLTGSSRLCMAGGVALNVVANTRIRNECGFSECFWQPCASDAGTSLGAALYVAHERGDARVTHPLTDTLGPSFTSAQCGQALARGRIPSKQLSAPWESAARALADGRIIGWFGGRAECGPRALGNRSILADPRRPDMKDVLNARVKFREPFRPFAPSILREACGTFFDDGAELGRSDTESPFMLLVYATRPEHVKTLASVTHVDGGGRVQTVTPEQNPRYYALIEAFGRLTGVPCVVNTSFNIRGEPIVNTPEDALKCFYTTDMDLLYLEDHLVWKDPALAALYG